VAISEDQHELGEMSLGIDPASPVIFLGVADGEKTERQVALLESTSLFNLAHVKAHFSFPILARQAVWCFLINFSAVDVGETLVIRLTDDKGNEVGKFTIGASSVVGVPVATLGGQTVQAVADQTSRHSQLLLDKGQWILNAAPNRQLVISEPGEYRLLLERKGELRYLGRVIYVFVPPPPLTEEQISALESDPVSQGHVVIRLGCKHCPSELKAYMSTKRSDEMANSGHIYYLDLPDRFVCGCGKANMNLEYLRQGGHGFLGRGARIAVGDISYVQRYAHSQLLEIAAQFLALVQKEKKEEVIQKFLENNKVLLARFHAQRLFIKPRILGKFNADFAVLDSQGVLTLIEIERPTLKLFKKNGHLRSQLNHAYEQVQDWLDEVARHRAAVIEGLGLSADQVLSIRGCVVAGRAKAEKREHLRRHLSQPRPSIEFLTLDALADNLVSMAGELP
jgi:hypothetical protein